MRRRTKEIITGVVLTSFISTFILSGVILLPKKVQAQMAVLETGPLTQTTVTKELKLTFWQSLMGSVLQAIMNTVTMTTQQFAYDMAVGLASGAKGQNPLAFLSDPGTYFTQLGQDAAGEFLGTLSDDWTLLGVGLCNPRLPDIALSIQLGLAEKFERPKPKCDWSQIANNWEALGQEISDPIKLLQHLSLSFEPGASDLSQAQIAFEAADVKRAEALKAGEAKRNEGQGVKYVEDIISGNITTPAAYTKKQFEDLAAAGGLEGQARQQQSTQASVLAGAIAGGGAWAAMGNTVFSTFVNTLSARLLKIGLEGLFKALISPEQADLKSLIGKGASTGGAGAARAFYSSLITPNIKTSSLDIISELASCPKDKPDTASLYQCALDEKFAQVLHEAQRGAALSVKEAVDKGYLDANKPFGFLNFSGDTPLEPSVDEGYAYHNMKKLRLARIIPVGWELAALKIKDFSQSAPRIYTLGEVMADFDKVGAPFYKMMDPNWILKAPPTQCAANVYGPLVDENGNRFEVCADIKHCIAEDAQGNCQSWGYCTREKNIWRINGDACDAQYASCQAYKSADGKRDAAYLENTLDFGSCNADNAGCRWYSRSGAMSQNGQDIVWSDVTDATKVGLNRIYLNSNALTCKADAAGCTEFISTTDQASASLFLKKPPAWLGCDGEDGEPKLCAQYARMCRSSEVGCQLYQPVNGDPGVPGIVGETDICPKDCVGYNAYKQDVSVFEPAIPAVYLIPSQAQTCDLAYAGCSEFTNLATEGREYFSSLRACQKPGVGDEETYYTWEGAENSGYQLRSWTLKRSNQKAGNGYAPCTNVDVLSDKSTCVDTATNQAVCTAADVGVEGKEDCRAFYDKDGNIFYRLYSRTVTVTDDCNKYRATGPNLVFDAALCGQYGGSWNGSTCKVADVVKGMATVDEYYCTVSHGSWDATYKECLFAGYPAESAACPASANTCRVFSGSAAANVKIVLGPETFENGTNNWEKSNNAPAQITAESSFLGGSSLKVESGGVRHNLDELTQGASYTLTVWAKGSVKDVNLTAKLTAYDANGQNVGAQDFPSSGLVNANNTAAAAVLETAVLAKVWPLKNDWQEIVFGPLNLNFSPTGNTPVLSLDVQGGAAYLDNVVLRQVQDKLPLLKNSLKIPEVCDTLPAAMGGGYAPQAMLGCAEYKDAGGATQYLKSFSSFCREQSAGCQELVDTYNFSDAGTQTFNQKNVGLCHGAPGNCYVSTDSQRLFACIISTGENSCEYSLNLSIDDLTVPADKHVYMVVDSKKSCQKEDRGCEMLGRKNLETGDWQTVYLRNNPDTYEHSLCKYEQDGCTAWASTEGTAYFKDPGNQTCEWKAGVDIGGVKYSGWFKKGNTAPLAQTVSQAGCVQLGFTWDAKNNQCLASNAPCYGQLLVTGTGNNLNLSVDLSATHLVAGTFGIWRNFDASYQGRAGECPKAQAGCKEFIDPTDKANNNSAGQAYYYLDNDNLDKNSCGGKVSRKEGCVLLNQTDITGQTWNAQVTYLTSEQTRQGGLVQPQAGIGSSACTTNDSAQGKCGNNTNVILKVQRDRVCGEWLACRSWMTDPSGNTLCTYYGRCQQIGLGQEKADSPTCKEWLTDSDLTQDPAHQTYIMADAANYLAERTDVEKTDRWSYKELSGYSIPDARPAERLQEFVATQTDSDVACDVLGGYCKGTLSSRPCQNDNDCKEPVRLGYFQPAGSDNLYALSSKECEGKVCQCADDADCAGMGLNHYVCEETNGFKHCVAPKICRGYPNLNSPLPKSLALAQNNQAATCAQGNCECSYVQYQAQGVNAYYPTGQLVSRICAQGAADKKGKSCKADSECQPGASADETQGYCASVSDIKYYNGWRGYCLDYDKDRSVAGVGQVGGDTIPACLAWAPVSLPQGEYSTFAQAPGAQYQVPNGREWYCVGQTPTIEVSRSLSCYITREETHPATANCTLTGQNPKFRSDKCSQTQIDQCAAELQTQFNDHIKTQCERYALDNGGNDGDIYPGLSTWPASCGYPGVVNGCARTLPLIHYIPEYTDPAYGGCGADGGDMYTYSDHRVTSVPSPTIKDISNFFDDPQFKDGGSVNSQSLADAQDDANCKNTIGFCAVAQKDARYRDHNADFGKSLSNFLGCYHLAADQNGTSVGSTSNVLFYPYKGRYTSPILAHQIDKFLIGVNENLDGAPADNFCEDNVVPKSSGDNWNDEGLVNWAAELKGTIPNQQEMKNNLTVWQWNAKKSFAGGTLAFAARYDNQERFLGIEIEAHDYASAGLFAITSFKMFLKPMCSEWVKVTDDNKGGKALAYTDNLLKQTKVNGVDKDEVCEPYGAVGYSADQMNEFKGYTGIISLTDDAIRKSKVCKENYAYPYTNWSDVANHLFAQTFEKMTVKSLSYLDTNFDDKQYPYDYGISYKFEYTNGVSNAEINGQGPRVTDLRINNSTEKRTFNSSVAPVTLSFYGSPDANQMPIRRIAVDWGDKTPILVIGDGQNSSFKARWPACDNSDFAHSPDACAERPFSFSHVYFCNGSGSVNWNQNLGACVFKPKVQIFDNWRFCNGSCSGGPAGSACYDASRDSNRKNECDTEKEDPWTSFTSEIIVTPPK